MPNYETELQLDVKGVKLNAVRYAKERGPEGTVNPFASFGEFHLVAASEAEGMSLHTLAAILFRDASQPKLTGRLDMDGNALRGNLVHRPYFLMKKDSRTGDVLVGWLSCPPDRLRKRMEREGMVRLNEQALAGGRLVPMPDWRI